MPHPGGTAFTGATSVCLDRSPPEHARSSAYPVYTDIDDRSFLYSVKAAIEKSWHVAEEGEEFRVPVLFRHKVLKDLYPDGPSPGRGDHIDEAAHLVRFPTDGAILTTGATTTHAFPRRTIVFGSQPLTWNVVADEFGHILGFGG